MKFNKNMLRLYAVTDRAWVGRQSLYEQISDAIDGGVTIVQLREKNLSEDEFIREAEKICALCHEKGIPLIINDNYNVALKVGADGVHVGIEDAPVEKIREIAGDDFIIGATAKTVEQAQNAEKSGADYIGVGAVFPSPTKRNAIRITNAQLEKITSSVNIPAVAIGGITLENVDEVNCRGLSGIAVVSAVFSAENIKNASALLREKAERLINK